MFVLVTRVVRARVPSRSIVVDASIGIVAGQVELAVVDVWRLAIEDSIVGIGTPLVVVVTRLGGAIAK